MKENGKRKYRLTEVMEEEEDKVECELCKIAN